MSIVNMTLKFCFETEVLITFRTLVIVFFFRVDFEAFITYKFLAAKLAVITVFLLHMTPQVIFEMVSFFTFGAFKIVVISDMIF